MKVEAVIVCKDYSDFLEHTLPENASHLDDIVVVTHKDDKKTQAVCNKNSIHFITTDVFTEFGHTFNKGAAINVGIDQLRGEDWILHLDADIVLCKDFRRMLTRAQLNKDNIYGADRVNVYGYDAWQKLKPKINRHYQDRWFVDPGFSHHAHVPENTSLGTRVLHKEYGWIPIGFFQLFHSSLGRRYNVKRGAASGTDVLFPAQWARENRVLLPEIVVYHLDSELEHKMGTNWKGRKSRAFEPQPVSKALAPQMASFASGEMEDFSSIGDAIKKLRKKLERELQEAIDKYLCHHTPGHKNCRHHIFCKHHHHCCHGPQYCENK